MNIDKKSLHLYAVTDRTWLSGAKLSDAVRFAIEGGATMVQLREKNLNFQELIKSAFEIKKVCREYGIPFIVNDNVYAAKEVDADGVHLGQDDMNAAEARKILGSGKIIGVTAKTPKQAQKAELDGADYLGSGAIFGSTTKSGAIKMELPLLKEITESVNIPVAAIGGINIDNVSKLSGTGIAGIAVVSGIFAAGDTKKAAADLYKKVGEII